MSAGPKGTPQQNAKIGVLAVQGDFAEHAARLRALGCETIELRCAADLDTALDAIVLPGGESTVQAALLEEFAMGRPDQADDRNGHAGTRYVRGPDPPCTRGRARQRQE